MWWGKTGRGVSGKRFEISRLTVEITKLAPDISLGDFLIGLWCARSRNCPTLRKSPGLADTFTRRFVGYWRYCRVDFWMSYSYFPRKLGGSPRSEKCERKIFANRVKNVVWNTFSWMVMRENVSGWKGSIEKIFRWNAGVKYLRVRESQRRLNSR